MWPSQLSLGLPSDFVFRIKTVFTCFVFALRVKFSVSLILLVSVLFINSNYSNYMALYNVIPFRAQLYCKCVYHLL